ncbi:enoyl-CoA delta isomerase 2 [Caerostris darwini]|uniref:Enoyl-CoA delta isomerase 2 n=1 Tax=Caerostris darwini TaxID=1538125 RepID=A0AAV4W0C7_9ARAC|nr:enoyl-CoA delta isomerase 2 [Caerostris darwini]
MDKRIQTISKIHGRSLPLKAEVIHGQPLWSRNNSFSSSSNDSTVFCSQNTLVTPRFQTETYSSSDMQHAKHLPKRKRNFSGSSLSSNTSCISDKDAKHIISSNSVPQVNGIKKNVESLSRLECTEICSNNFNIQHETLHDHVDYLNTPNSSSLFRHNLRKNIRKKTCNCDCSTSSCNLIVRRYKEKSFEEETIVLSTNHQISLENDVSPTIVNDSSSAKKLSFCKTENINSKSKDEQLLDSLNAITCSKSFSPEKILKQLCIRQEASNSVVSKLSKASNSPPQKPFKKQKLNKDQFTNSVSTSSLEEIKSNEANKSLEKTSITLESHSKNDSASMIFVSSENSITANSKISDILDSDKKRTTPLSHEMHCKASVLKFGDFSELSSILHKNGLDKNEDEGCVSKKLVTRETSSKQPESFKNLEQQQFSDNELSKSSDDESGKSLNEESSKSSYDESSKDCLAVSAVCCSTPDYPPSFYDIAEEGIRTIDACFREVGEESMVSPCNKNDDLPQLMSVTDNVLNRSIDENPPILSPCVSPIKLQNGGCKVISDFSSIAKSMYKEKLHRNTKSEDLNSRLHFQNSFSEVSNNKKRQLSLGNHTVNNSLTHDTGKTIFNKYLKLLRAKAQVHEVKNCESYPKKNSFSSINETSHGSIVNKPVILNCNRALHVPEIPSSMSFKLKNSRFRFTKKQIRTTTTTTTTNKEASFKNTTKKKAYYQRISNCVVNSSNESSSCMIDARSRFLKKSINFPSSRNKCTNGFKKFKSFSFSSSAAMSSNAKKNFRIAGCQNGNYTILPTSNKNASHLLSSERTYSERTSSCFVPSDNNKAINRITSSATNKITEPAVKDCINNMHLQPSSCSANVLPEHKKGKNEDHGEVPRSQIPFYNFGYQTIKVSRVKTYAQVQLKLNRGNSIFLTIESLKELKDVLHKISQDGNCHTFILNGIGDAFCLGLDLLPLLGPEKLQASSNIAEAVKEFIVALSTFKKAFIAVVNGSAFGLGMTILNHADVCIASYDAKFCLPQCKQFGYFPEGGACYSLTKVLGPTRALDMILQGSTISAKKAKEMNLISDVVESKCLPCELVSRVKVFAKSPLDVLKTAKNVQKMHFNLELLTILESEMKLLPKIWLSKDCQEALQKSLIARKMNDRHLFL